MSRWVGPIAAGILAVLTAGCERVLAPREVSFLAIVALIDAPRGVSAGSRFRYRVREVSGTLPIDTLVVVAPADTVILQLPAATYSIELENLPASCSSRYGPNALAAVDDGGFTTLLRYYISCRPSLTVQLFSEGVQLDSDIAYRLVAPDGSERLGSAGAFDTLRFDSLPPGRYEFHVHLVADNCVVTSDGGARRVVDVPLGGGGEADVRIGCSDETQRPRLLDFRASYHDGAGAFVARATDPNRDIERYYWDLTDCRGTSVLPDGARLRRGLSAGRTRDQDTVLIVAAFEVGLADSALAGRCAALRVADENSNTTPVVQVTLAPSPGGVAPAATSYNAFLVGTQAARVALSAADADNDFGGVFVAARLRDGVLGPPDGAPDVGVYNVAGYLDTTVPDLPLGGRIHYDDVLGVIVYLVDRAGHFTRLEDADIFH